MARLRFLAVALAFASAFWLSNAHAEDDLDVTMTMFGADEPLTETVVQEIRLPEFPRDGANSNVRAGAETAKGRREAARDLGERIAERAREERENEGRRAEREHLSGAGPEPGLPGRGRPEPIQPESPERPPSRTGR